jgi:nucleoside-diphosphate-sugar epimerase
LPVVKRVLVTGGGGYIGCVLVGILLERGWTVRVLERLYWETSPLERWLDRIELVQEDVREVADEVLEGIDGVIHLAGLSNDPTAEYNPEANWQMNAVATRSLAEACKRMNVSRFVFGSSCSLYDGLPAGPVYDEETSVQPRGAYATSKHYGEQALLELADSDFSPVILRQGTVYGLSPRMRFDLVVNTFVKDAVQNGELRLHGGGWMWRPLVGIRDAVMAQILCLEAPRDKVHAQVFNVVHDNYQIRELAMLVAGSAQMRKYSVKLTDAPLPEIVRDYRCDSAKIRSELGFAPQLTVLQAAEEMLQWVERDGVTDFNHPRYYNIRWMTLLEEVRPQLTKFASVF